MSGIRISVDDSRLRVRLEKVKRKVQARAFTPQIIDFARKVLNTCIRTTPQRPQRLITRNQRKQYSNRVNYIPSVHAKTDPMLIVNEMGEHWLYCFGKWYNAGAWRIPAIARGAYQMLESERNRRLQLAESDFIARRVQARNLYRKSWLQVGDSLGINLIANSEVRSAVTRRDPPKNPPRGYGQRRGGEHTLSVVVYNPFLEQESEYKPWSGKAILANSIAYHEPAFIRAVDQEMRRRCR